jgi:hypothetical protein
VTIVKASTEVEAASAVRTNTGRGHPRITRVAPPIAVTDHRSRNTNRHATRHVSQRAQAVVSGRSLDLDLGSHEYRTCDDF